jgi:hypothetical protein
MKNHGFNVLVKTNSYAGNFERELCAFMTGHIGECGVGEEFINPIIKSTFEGYIEDELDDHACYRPVALDETNSHNLIIFFVKKPTEGQFKTLKERAKLFEKTRPYEYLDPDFRFLGIELQEVSITKTVTKLA